MSAIPAVLQHTSSIGGARYQIWELTGDASGTTVRTNLKRIVACWLQNQDDTTVLATQVTASGVTVTTADALTNAKKWWLNVIGE